MKTNPNRFNLSVFALIILLGLTVLSSFGRMDFSQVNWYFALLCLAYVIILTIVSWFLRIVFVNHNGLFNRARRELLQKYDYLEQNHKWEIIFNKSLECNQKCCLYNAYISYSIHRIKKNNNDVLSKKEFRELFVSKKLNKKHLTNLPIKYRQGILSMQKKQDDNYWWDKKYNAYRRGDVPAKNIPVFITTMLGFFFSVAGFVASILLSIHLSAPNINWLHYSYFAILLVGEVVYLILSVRSDIHYEKTLCEAIISDIDFFLGAERRPEMDRVYSYFDD